MDDSLLEKPKRSKIVALVVLVACIGLAAGGIGAWIVAASVGPGGSYLIQPSGNTPQSGSAGIPTAVVHGENSVVTIVTAPQTLEGYLSGSETGIAHGVVVSATGTTTTVLTTIGAVTGSTELKVITTAGVEFSATISALDPAHGLAALLIDQSTSLTPLPVASSAAGIGTQGYVMFPGLVSPSTFSTGGVEYENLDAQYQGNAISEVGILGAETLPAESGVPVLDGDGNVIGIVASGITGVPTGQCAFLSSVAASAFVSRIGSASSTGQPTFDASSILVDETAAAVYGIPAGALITAVSPGGAAARAGLRAGDVVLSVGGITIGGIEPFDALSLGLVPGATVTVAYDRDGVKSTTTVTVASQ